MRLLYEITLKSGEKQNKEIECITRCGAFNQLQKIENIIKAEEIKFLVI